MSLLMGYRRIPVGASPLAKRPENPTRMPTDPTHSRAGSLPQSRSAFYLELPLLSPKLTLT
ncbi:hypothetical protein F7R15_17815 [Pseudomonas reinekei]|uniref:Uncharacterized protein n=1 Tax=Pseudomonas reinekei TaxID=395598 RepID=A0A6H9RFL8_PSERE|nr:hypothetical protein F7R15_17815 [Pseudomonas reinekei]